MQFLKAHCYAPHAQQLGAALEWNHLLRAVDLKQPRTLREIHAEHAKILQAEVPQAQTLTVEQVAFGLILLCELRLCIAFAARVAPLPTQPISAIFRPVRPPCDTCGVAAPAGGCCLCCKLCNPVAPPLPPMPAGELPQDETPCAGCKGQGCAACYSTGYDHGGVG